MQGVVSVDEFGAFKEVSPGTGTPGLCIQAGIGNAYKCLSDSEFGVLVDCLI
jgi:hypothetical protein